MANKELERMALNQIKMILDSLGEESYVGAALQDDIKQAEMNIECDFLLSMSQHYESRLIIANQQIERLRKQRDKLISENEQLAKTLECANKNISWMGAKLQRIKTALNADEGK